MTATIVIATSILLLGMVLGRWLTKAICAFVLGLIWWGLLR